MSMGGFFDQFPAWLLTVLLFAAMVGAWFLGWSSTHSRPTDGGEPPAEKFSDASVMLLGLLLAFTFSMGLEKHQQRRSMVVVESNAIGDFYTCVSLLEDEPLRAKLQDLVRDYAQYHITILDEHFRGQAMNDALKRLDRQTGQMTDLVRQAAGERSPVIVPLTNTLNEVTSAKASRISAVEDRIPTPVILLLMLTALIAMALSGRRHGALRKPQHLGFACIAVLFGLTIFIILDLDDPDRGLITVSQSPMIRLVESLKAQP